MEASDRIALAQLNLRLTELEEKVNAIQQGCMQMLVMLGYLGSTDRDLKTQLQTLEVFVGVPQE